MTATKDDFNPLVFEKKLTQLKDTQDSIQGLSAWCLQHKQHHKKIVASWLNVLKRAKVDQRLTLFYLANDVIQYSKRKNYEFVGSWGTTLQKATPLVRDEKVKHRILRIFKIWEERSVYDEEFLTDLTGLLSAGAGKPADSEPGEFQAMQLINKIKQCSVLEAETDLQLKKIHDSSISLKDIDQLCASLKERRDAEEAAQEVEEGVVRLEAYVRALQRELVARSALCHLLHAAMQHYGLQMGEVKVVANAYRNFGSRVRNLNRRLDELCDSLPPSAQQSNTNSVKANAANNVNSGSKTSPVPSPPQPGETVPSPGPDEDIDLPQDGGEDSYNLDKTFSSSLLGEAMSKGFTSFLGSAEFPFFGKDGKDVLNSGSKIEVISSKPPDASSDGDFSINDFFKSLIQPKPDNDASETIYSSTSSFLSSTNSTLTPPPLPPTLPGLDLLTPTTPTNSAICGVPPPGMLVPPPPPPLVNNFYGSNSSEPVGVPPPDTPYNDHPQQWNNSSWENSMDTPESPPHHEAMSNMSVPPPPVYTEPPPPPPRVDVDHRSLQHITQPPPAAQHNSLLDGDDVDHRVLPSPMQNATVQQDRNRSHKDVDHRNLISLTGTLPPPPAPPLMGSWSPRRQSSDQDYRSMSNVEMIPPPPLPAPLRRSSSLRDSPPPAKMAKNPPPVMTNLPPHMPSHTPDMSQLPPSIPDMSKLPPNLSSPPPMLHGHPPMMPWMSKPGGYNNDLSQVPLPPNVHSQNMMMHGPPPPVHMTGMPVQTPFSSHPNDQNMNVGVSHLPPSSMLKHPPDVLNQNCRSANQSMPPPLPGQHHHNSMMMGRPHRTDIVESIDMEMSDDEMIEDEYSHLGMDSMGMMHNSNKRTFSNNNRVLVGGNMSTYPPAPSHGTGNTTANKHGITPAARSNLVRINSISEEDMKKDEKNTKSESEVVKSAPVEDILMSSNDFLLTDNLISDDEDFFKEIGGIDNDDDKGDKSPDIFDEVLLSSSNPENPSKVPPKESIKPQVVEEQNDMEDVEKNEEIKGEPAKWMERASAMNPSGPPFPPRPPFYPRGSPHGRFRQPSIFHRIRAPHNDFRPQIRPRPWGARPPRGYW